MSTTATIAPGEPLSLLVKNILVFEDDTAAGNTNLAFYADGFPGLMFQHTGGGMLAMPHNKEMPQLFLYGQTIEPVELIMQGPYRLVAFQLYPFVIKTFFNVDPASLNDGCYDLTVHPALQDSIDLLNATATTTGRIDILSNFLLGILSEKSERLDLAIRDALQLIIESNGQATVNEICKTVHLTRRTFERRFLHETGITAKQFAVMIRFQSSLQQLTQSQYTRLSDIVYNNGFADQSHFIRVFKAFTGKTPKRFSGR
jgi:AraC-like DNA-binding protein